MNREELLKKITAQIEKLNREQLEELNRFLDAEEAKEATADK